MQISCSESCRNSQRPNWPELGCRLLKRLSEETGVSVRFATLKDIPNFKQCLARGAYELAYMNPYHFTVFNKLSGYRATVGQMIAGGYRGKT